MKTDGLFKYASLTTVWVWLFIFSLLPFVLILGASFMHHSESHLMQLPLTFENYKGLGNSIYLRIFERSFVVALSATFFCLLLGYPFAYLLARVHSRIKNLLILLVIIPFWTSSLIRSYALIAIIKTRGLLNSLLLHLHLIHQPLSILFTNKAVMVGLVYNLLPFMILPIMTNVERLDERLIDAARDLGASRLTTLRRIIIPLTMPGIISGSILVFLPAMTLFYISDILGGAKSVLLGNLIQNEYLIAENWPLGSAVSIMLTMVLALLIAINMWAARGNNKQQGGWL